jgi:hypothetical protein
MVRLPWPRGLAAISVLGLIAAGCQGQESGVDTPEAEETAGAVEPEQVTAYVVGYHWGWAIFDEDGGELEVLEVPVGTKVELIAVNDLATHAIDRLSPPVAETIRSIDWHERAHTDVEMGRTPDPEAERGMAVSDVLAIDRDIAPHHSLMVTGIGAVAFLDGQANEPERLVFTVEREGVHEFRCMRECGFGHDSQRRKMLVVTA